MRAMALHIGRAPRFRASTPQTTPLLRGPGDAEPPAYFRISRPQSSRRGSPRRERISRGPTLRRNARHQFFGGRMTESITWITPLVASMSVLTTWAPSIMTLPFFTAILTLEPCTVGAAVIDTT